MGLIYSKIKLYAESENCYEKALKLEPDNESYKKNLEVINQYNTVMTTVILSFTHRLVYRGNKTEL